MSISARIKVLRESKKLSQVAFAKALGVTSASISYYESGKRHPDSSFLSALTNVYRVNTNWLLTGEGEMFKQLDSPSQSARPPGKSYHIPVIEDIAAGSPIDVTDFEPDHFIDIPGTALLLPPPYYAFQVSGNSMEPEIYASDIVIVSGSWYDISLDDRICAFRTGEGIILKRLELNHKSKFGKLYSINYRAHKPIKYDRDTEDLTLIGVLCLLVRNYLREDK